jgi:chromosome segregation ATPase
MDSPRAMRRPSAPARSSSTTSTHVGTARKQNDSQSEAKVLEDQFTSIFQRIYDVATAAAPLMIQKERAQQKKEREERDAKKYEMLTTGFPAAAEQREDQKRKLAETIKQNDIKLEQNLAQRDKIARDFGHLVSSIIPQPAEPSKGHNTDSEERHLKLFGELEQMNSKLDSKASDIRSLKKIEADVAEVRKESKTSNEKLNVLQEKGDRQAKTLTELSDRVTKEEKEAGLLQARHAQLKIELSQLQIQAKTPQGLDHVNEDIRGLSTRIAQGLGHVNDNLSDLSTLLESHGKTIQRLEQGGGSQEKQPTAISEQIVKLEAAFDKLTKGLQEANSEFQEFKNDQEEVNKLFKRYERFSSVMAGDTDLENRVVKLEELIETMNQELEKRTTYQLRKEDMLFEEMENMKTGLANVEKEVRQTQADILGVTTGLTKTNVNMERLAKNQLSPSSSNNASPRPQALQIESSGPLAEVQKQLKQHSMITNQVQQQVQHYTQIVSAMSQALQALEGRYSNLTTEPIIKSMVQYMQEMYPYASNAQAEIESIKTRLLAFQDKADRQELQTFQTQITQLEGSLQALTGRLEEGETRFSNEENKQLEKSLKWSEQRQGLLDRLEELKKAFDEYQNTCTEELGEYDGRIKVLERHSKTGNLVEPDTEPGANHTDEVHEAQGSRSDNTNVNGQSQEHRDRQGEAESATNDRDRRKRPRVSSSRASEFEMQRSETKPDVNDIVDSATEPQPRIVRRFLTKDNLRKRKHGADGDEVGAA